MKTAKKIPVQQFASWSASRVDDYQRCPRFAKYKHLDKLCPSCFDGKIRGGFGTPAICTGCGEELVKGPALVRGDEIGNALDGYLQGEVRSPPATILHPKVKEIVKQAKAEVKKGTGNVQVNVKFDRKWKLIPGDGWDPNAWVFARLDFFRVNGSIGHVIDWKTGGIEKDGKQKGKVKVLGKYDFALKLYNATALLLYSKLEAVQPSSLVFLDALPPHNPVVEREGLTRAQLPQALEELEAVVEGMMQDTDFATNPTGLCRFCDFGKGKGGPCDF